MEIKIKWIKRKQTTHENTYRDDTCIYVRTIDFVLFACKRPRGSYGLAGRKQVLLILVPHIDSRVKIIDNERPEPSTHIILKINVMICIYFVLI